MQTVLNNNIIIGTFIKELKNRFLCEVNINGKSTVCYVPSSCHLSNFLKLKGKRVILIPTKSNGARTKYALFAVPYKRSYIILNTSMANKAIESNIGSRRFSYLGKRKAIFKEHYIEEYKSDLFIRDTNTIIEIKSVISTNTYAEFPTVFSERSLKQLKKLLSLLTAGYKVHYIIVSLNPYVKGIEINTETEFACLLASCLKLGMTITSFSCKYSNYSLVINKKIPIIMEEKQ